MMIEADKKATHGCMHTCCVVVHYHSLYLHAILQLQQQLGGVSSTGRLTVKD